VKNDGVSHAFRKYYNCHLQVLCVCGLTAKLLLALASTVFPGAGFLETHDQIVT
jgi:hypothetical protein